MRTATVAGGLAIELIPEDYFRLLRREEIFPDTSRALELDVGCGDGTFLMEMAAHFQDRDFLGIERLGGASTLSGGRSDSGA